jgi:PleD family two-component response regulator
MNEFHSWPSYASDMRDIDFVELISLMRTCVTSEETAIMAISTEASLDSVRQAFVAGADDYLITPYDPGTLERKIDHLLSQTTSLATAGVS